eukprot:350561-Chlamydomonas_euryale.AAC.3
MHAGHKAGHDGERKDVLYAAELRRHQEWLLRAVSAERKSEDQHVVEVAPHVVLPCAHTYALTCARYTCVAW